MFEFIVSIVVGVFFTLGVVSATTFIVFFVEDRVSTHKRRSAEKENKKHEVQDFSEYKRLSDLHSVHIKQQHEEWDNEVREIYEKDNPYTGPSDEEIETLETLSANYGLNSTLYKYEKFNEAKMEKIRYETLYKQWLYG